MLLAASLLLAPVWPTQDAKQASAPEIRCVIVDRQNPALVEEGPRWVGEPGAAALVLARDGIYAALEFEGHNGGTLSLHLSRSTDNGVNWVRVPAPQDIGAASLFEDGGALYLMGIMQASSVGWPVICRSSDQGKSWTKPSSATTGILRGQAQLAACSGPAVRSGGRIWRAFTRGFVPPGSSRRVHALIASASVGGDLLDAGSWRWSNELPLDGLKGYSWDASHLVVDGEDGPSLVLRASREVRAVARLSADGFELRTWEPRPSWFACDALAARYERDRNSGLVHVLAAFPDSLRPPIPPVTLASEVSLLATRDLAAWDLRTVLLRGEPSARLTCADWAIDGEDLVAVVGGALNEKSDARALLFLRVPKFRERKFGDAPARVTSSGK